MQLSHLSPLTTGPRVHNARPAAASLRQRCCVTAFAVGAPRQATSTPRSSSIRVQDEAAVGQQRRQQKQQRAPHTSWGAGLVFTSMATVVMLASSAPSALARLELPNKEVDDATSPFVQKLLKRSEENRERYQKERLQDYNRRNFKEYFEFEASSAKVARARGLSAESQEAIAKWLQDNK